jgi:hypothetical protein
MASEAILKNYRDKAHPLCYSFLAEDGGETGAKVPTDPSHGFAFPLHFPETPIDTSSVIWIRLNPARHQHKPKAGPVVKPELDHQKMADELDRRLRVVGDSIGRTFTRQNTPGDGNCQFHAIVGAVLGQPQVDPVLRASVAASSPAKLRQMACDWLESHLKLAPESNPSEGEKTTSDGISLRLLRNIAHSITLRDGSGWEEYVKKMRSDGCWGDEITLRTVCQLLNIRISVVAAYRDSDITVINPTKLYSSSVPLDESQPPPERTIWLSNYNNTHYEWLVITPKK